jgi:hypothetical protein
VLSPQQPFHCPQLKHFHLANHHFIGKPHTGHGGTSFALLGSIPAPSSIDNKIALFRHFTLSRRLHRGGRK